MSMMNEGAPPPDDEMAEGPQPPQEEAAEPGEGAKQSQQAANYREGNPQRNCGLCADFDSKAHGCNTVDGDISPFGFCDIYVRQDNPFREGEKESFEGGSPAAPAPAAGPPPGLMQIGRQTYGGGA